MVDDTTLDPGLAALKTHTRNHYGLKDSANMWRTVNGQHYTHRTTVFDKGERLAAYRAAGIRCRQFGEEIFVHHQDDEAAERVDMAISAAERAAR